MDDTEETIRIWNDTAGNRAVTEYNVDFNLYSHRAERKRKFFHHQSPQFPYRASLLEFIKQICASRAFSQSCVHLAVYFLDLYMDYHHISTVRLDLVAIASISMAASVEENIATVPRLSDIFIWYDSETLQYYNELKLMMLEFFNFDLLIPTPAHHLTNFMREMITSDEIRSLGKSETLNNMSLAVVAYQDYILLDVHLIYGHSPSKIAAAIIASCRIKFGLSPWNEDLKNISQYDIFDFQSVLNQLGWFARPYNCANCHNHNYYVFSG